MDTITIILILLLAVVVSSFVSRVVPFSVPLPLVQIAIGACIGLIADLRVTLNPDIFFLLFLPPLLFLDGWRIPREELFKDRSVILELSLGLVIFTVVGAGLFINWLIPAMPLAVAFALAAVLSPTDPIAVSAIAKRAPIPKRMMHILEGESLLNDASGLVCLRFAIAAALTGTFSLYDATLSFLWVAVAGIAVGVILTFCITRIKDWISSIYGEDSGSQILISLLIPFASYLAAEHIGGSGILAAVAAGLTMSFSEAHGQAHGVTRIRRNSVWDTIQLSANGIIFVLLGEQLPTILAGAKETVQLTGHHEPWWIAIYVIAINVGLAVLRFAWVWISLQLTLFRRKGPTTSPNWRIVAAMSFAGVRGAITLAGILTLPFTMTDGTPFPARDLAILLAMGAIIVSLVAASFALPLLLKGLELPPEKDFRAEEDAARIAAAHAAIDALIRTHRLRSDGDDAQLYSEAASRIMEVYRHRIDNRSQEGEAAQIADHYAEIERELRRVAVEAERTEIFRAARSRDLGSETANKLIRELDLLEARYSGK